MSFVAAAFLAGLALLAVPWWLHRRRSGHPEQQVVSSLLLMRPSELPERSRKQVQHRWLLALRMLLLAALAVTFAQPLLERSARTRAPMETLPRLIAMDTSLSMGVNFDRARARARDIIDGLPAGSMAAVVSAADELTVMATMTGDRSVLRAAVDALKPGAGRLAFEGLIGRLTALAGTLVDGAVRVDLVSDFQQSAMPGQFNGLIDGAAGPVILHRLASSEENWLVETIVVEKDVRVRVRGLAAPLRHLEVTLDGEEGELGRREVTVPAGGVATLGFPLPEERSGDTWLRASITNGDALPSDDVRYHVLRRPREVPMPLFTSPGAETQVAYLAAAIGAATPRFRLEAPEHSGPVAVLVDPGGAPAGSADRLLERHLGNGGAVLMTVGPATRRATRLAAIDAAVGAATLAPEPRGVVAVDRRHPALARFGEWRAVTVSRHLVVEPGTGNVLLTLDDGTPLLVEHRRGAGRILVLLTALDPAWSNLVTTPAFVTFVADALGYLAEDTLPTAAVAGEPLVLPGVGAQLFDRSGRRMLALQETVGGTAASLLEPGVFTLRTPNRERLLAVNPDRRESDLAPADPELLARWEAATHAVALPAQVSDAADGKHTVPLAPWMLALLVMLAVSEAVAANAARSARWGANA